MRKIFIAAALILALVGCKPEGGTGGGNGGGAVGRVDFEIELAAKTDRDIEARRVIDCSVTGYKGKDVVYVIDQKTGKRAPYHLNITHMHTPIVMKIKNPDGATRIYVECTMYGNPGDTIFCEARTSRHTMAALFSSREFARAEPPHYVATCFANINAAESL